MFAGLAQAKQSYTRDRYKVIVDRAPFGAELINVAPPVESATKITIANLEKKCRLSFLFKSNSGEIRAGFQNLHPQKGEPTSSIILIGESFMGMKLKSVDLNNSVAKLEYNGKMLTFALKKQKTLPKTSRISRHRPNRRHSTKPRQIHRPPPRKKLSTEEQRKRREEIRKNLQKYQMEVLRKGMPPLPVRLTPEQDAKLVEERVLPPLN